MTTEPQYKLVMVVTVMHFLWKITVCSCQLYFILWDLSVWFLDTDLAHLNDSLVKFWNHFQTLLCKHWFMNLDLKILFSVK